MKRRWDVRGRGFLGLVLAGALAMASAPAAADMDVDDLDTQLQRLRQGLEAQGEALKAQEAELYRLRLEREAETARDEERRAAETAARLAAGVGNPEKRNAAFTAGWDRGFVLQSTDDRYRLQIGGWIQPRYEFTREPDAENLSSFFLRRVRLDVRGHVFDENLTFRIMPDLSRTATLRDAWIDYAFDRSLQARMGQFTVPFQWHRFVSPRRQHFAERSVPSETIGFPAGRDIGVMIHGRNGADTLAYGVGFFDGAGRNEARSNSDGNMVSARITRALLGNVPREESDYAFSEEPAFSIGGGVQSAWKNEVRAWDLGRSPVENERADWVTGTVDASFRWQGFSAATEGYLRRVDPDDSTVDSYTSWGAMLSAGYFVVPRQLEIVGRWSRLRLDDDASETRETQWGAGLNVYHWGHDWKTRVNYFNDDTTTGRSHVVLVEHHLQF